jgi:hypothetical protein
LIRNRALNVPRLVSTTQRCVRLLKDAECTIVSKRICSAIPNSSVTERR